MITKSEFNILAKNLDLSSQDSWSKDYWIKHKDRYFNNILLIDKYCSGTKILEIGSYPFHQTLLLKKMNYNITGFDLNPERQMQFITDNELNIIKNEDSINLIKSIETHDSSGLFNNKRIKDINKYKKKIDLGVNLGNPLYISGAVLNKIGGSIDPYEIFMIDGARRLIANVLCKQKLAKIWLIVLK